MKVDLKGFTVSINEEAVRSSKNKTSFVNQLVKDHTFTGIGEEVLKEKFSEAYDLIKKK